MTAVLLAVMLSDSALGIAHDQEFRLDRDAGLSDLANTVRSTRRPWTPRVDSWDGMKSECPAFFAREIDGFGIVRVGPKCDDEELPYAL